MAFGDVLIPTTAFYALRLEISHNTEALLLRYEKVYIAFKSLVNGFYQTNVSEKHVFEIENQLQVPD